MKFFGRVWDPGYYRTNMESSSETPGYRGVQAEGSRARWPGDVHRFAAAFAAVLAEFAPAESLAG